MTLYKARVGARRCAVVALLLASTALPAVGEAMLLTPSSQAAPAVSQKAAPADQAVTRQRPVHVDLQYLASRMDAGLAVTIELFDGHTIVIDPDRIQRRRPGSYSFFGKVRGAPDSPTQLTVVDGYLAGLISLRESKGRSTLYRIESNGDAVHWLQEVDPDAFPADHAPGEENMIVPSDAKAQADAEPQLETAAADSGTTIDVMVVYSNNVAAVAGAAIGSQIQAAVDSANQVYANSGVGMRLRLVHHAQVNYADSGNFNTDLNRLTSTTDGYFDDVHALRNTHGADLVSLFVEGGNACGIGWLNSNAAYAFNVVKRGCATGSHAFVHEVGHNMGARHDAYMDAGTAPYPHAHGMIDLVARFRTVMSYPNECSAAGVSCPRIPHLSNPNVTYGVPPAPTGTNANGTAPTANNARVHNDRAYTVANFRLSNAGGCSYALSPASLSVAAGGGSVTTAVTAGAGCVWNAASNVSWLSIGSTSGTTGTGTLYVNATANTGAARSGSITVGNQTLAVSQASGCTYTVSPASVSVGAEGGMGTASVTTASGCGWTASSGTSWMTIASGANGSGTGTVTYSVAANTGTTRSANLQVATKTVMVTQSAGTTSSTAAASLTPAELKFSGQGDTLVSTFANTGTVTLTISLAPGGGDVEDFVPSGTCASGQTLAAGQTCTLKYTFVPTAKGTRAASVNVSSAAGVKALKLTGATKPRGKK